jgi:hypothetical protein
MNSGARPIAVSADVPDGHRKAVDWLWGHAAHVWGHPVELTFGQGSREPDLTYGPAPSDHPGWLRFDSASYERRGQFSVHERDGRQLWGGAVGGPDLLGGMYRMLTFADEHAIRPEQRNRLGVFDSTALPAARAAVLDRLLVENHLDALWERVKSSRPDAERLPLWPNGKRWACVLTHDTDATRLGAPVEIIYNLGKFVSRRDPMRLRMAAAGMRHRTTPTRDPYFGFPLWREREHAWDARSVFFLSLRPRGIRRDFHDVRSTITGAAAIPMLREMAAEGWEFGLHASIHARASPQGLHRSRNELASLLDLPIDGIRHHYWALDWESPWRTFQQHHAAGFRYDSSIAMRDTVGFRAGTSLPFQPFDPDSQCVIAIWELPTAIMDGHLLNAADPQAAEQRAIDLIRQVRQAGGVLVLNWHTESAGDTYDRRGYVVALERILSSVRGTSDAWITTPGPLLDHWEARARAVGPTAIDR